MAFMITKEQTSSAERIEAVSTQLLLKPSPESLDREVVVRRLRHHKTMSRVKNAIQALVGPTLAESPEEIWLQRGDAFTSP